MVSPQPPTHPSMRLLISQGMRAAAETSMIGTHLSAVTLTLVKAGSLDTLASESTRPEAPKISAVRASPPRLGTWQAWPMELDGMGDARNGEDLAKSDAKWREHDTE